MAHAFTPGLAALEHATVRKVRELPVSGTLLKKEGDIVACSDVVARAYLPGDLQILRIAEKMGIEPFEVMRGLTVGEGAQVAEGDVVCEHAGLLGLFKTRFVSPCAGQVEFVTERTGHVGIRMAARPIEIDAYISGRVVALDPHKSLTIESEAALVQGIFGVGGERRGELKMLPVPPGKRLEEDDIPPVCNNVVLVGGMRPTLAALKKAQAGGAVGLVVGSIDDQALRGYLGFDLGIALTGDEPVSMTVIVSEGFGSMPICERVYSLLRAFDGKTASINGATQVRAGAQRPEIIVCHPPADGARAGERQAPVETGLRVGSRVRIIRVPHFGAAAEVVELPQELQHIPTGAQARVLRAKLEGSGETITVPRANVELM